jgi:DNA invertase Pin-like site-specific DNA recombinase
MVREFEALGVDLVVLDQAIDTTTPAGRLLFHILASISEFERDLIRDRVLAGLKRAKAQGVRLGRPRAAVNVLRARGMLAEGKSLRQVAKALHVALATLARAVPRAANARLSKPEIGAV